jgi:hypothetical protein
MGCDSLGQDPPALRAEQDPEPHQDEASPHPIPQRHFAHIRIDLVGPLQFNNNCNYIFIIIDRTSK